MNRKGTVGSKRTALFHGPSKRFIAMLLLAASTLFYGIHTFADEETTLTSVTIIDGENIFEVETKGQTVLDALKTADITLEKDDELSESSSGRISDGDVILVNRAKTIFLETGGETFQIVTTKKTVGEALLADGFQVGKYDEVIPNVGTPITENMRIRVTRVYVELYEVNESLPYTTKTVERSDKDTNYKNVKQAGQAGNKVRTYKKITKDGAGATATLIGEVVEKKPVEEIIEIGTKKPTVSNPSNPSASESSPEIVQPSGTLTITQGKTSDGIPYHAMPAMAQNNSTTSINGNTAITASGTFTFKKRIECKATAYEGSAASNGKWAGKTATGRAPVYGVVAVDPSVIPLNSKLYIESADGGKSWIYGFAVAGDTGGAIKGKKVDLCYHTLSQCYDFGRRDCIVYVLE